MRLYNTLSGRKEEFRPLEEGKVRMYVCGPTVYNLIHIGNARPMIVFDTVRRYFEYKGYEVNYVSNFTDVDDKIIKAANEEGVESSVISERYITECRKDMEAMNVRPATTHPKATEEIDIDDKNAKDYQTFSHEGKDFESTSWYDSGSHSDDSGWDSDSNWDSGDSWDSGGTDWDSDW